MKCWLPVLAALSLLLSCGGGSLSGLGFDCGPPLCTDFGNGLFVTLVCPDCTTGGTSVDKAIRVGQVASVTADATVSGQTVACPTGVWSSTSSSVATVTGVGKTGSVTGVAQGITTISVQLDCGPSGSGTASFILGVAAG